MHAPPWKFSYYAFFILLSFVVSCKDNFIVPDDISPTGWKPILAGPLIHGDLDVNDIFENGGRQNNLEVDENHLLVLVYKGQLLSFDATDSYQLPNQNWNANYVIPATGVTPIDQEVQLIVNETFSFTMQTPLDMNDDPIQLIKAIFSGGAVQLLLDADIELDFAGTATIPQMTDESGYPLVLFFEMTNGQPYLSELNMAGYSLVMSPANVLDIQLSGTVSVNALDVVSGAGVEIDFAMTGLAFKELRGYLGQFSIASDQDSIAIDIFRSTIQGDFQLLNPTLRLSCQNSFGLPCRISFDDLKTIDLNSGEEFSLIGPGFPNPLDLNFPADPGIISTTEILINNSNSNIEYLLNPAPKILYAAMHALSNPEGNASGNTTNFVTDESRFEIDVELKMPLEGFANLSFRDTLPLDFTGGTFPNQVEKIELRNIISNRFPFEAVAQVYLLDENDFITDSLFNLEQVILPSAQIDDDGQLIASGEIAFDVQLDEEGSRRLLEAKHVIISAKGITRNYTTQQVVQIRDNQKLSFSIGAKIFTNLSDID